MNSKWLSLTTVAGFAAVLIAQAIAPASADAHDDWVRRHRNDARSHRTISTRGRSYRITSTRNRSLPVHTGAWHVNQANESNARNGRGTTNNQRFPSSQWNNNRTDHRNNTDHRDNADHRNNADHRDNKDHHDNRDHH